MDAKLPRGNNGSTGWPLQAVARVLLGKERVLKRFQWTGIRSAPATAATMPSSHPGLILQQLTLKTFHNTFNHMLGTSIPSGAHIPPQKSSQYAVLLTRNISSHAEFQKISYCAHLCPNGKFNSRLLGQSEKVNTVPLPQDIVDNFPVREFTPAVGSSDFLHNVPKLRSNNSPASPVTVPFGSTVPLRCATFTVYVNGELAFLRKYEDENQNKTLFAPFEHIPQLQVILDLQKLSAKYLLLDGSRASNIDDALPSMRNKITAANAGGPEQAGFVTLDSLILDLNGSPPKVFGSPIAEEPI